MSHTPHLRPTSTMLAAAALGAALAGSLAAGPIAATAAPAVHATHSVHAMHSVHVRGVTLRVPTSWHAVSHRGLPGCIVDPDAPDVTARQSAFGQNDCQLQVLAGRRLPAAATPDQLYSPGDPAQCRRGSGSVDRHTVAARLARVGGVAAEYRRFALACLDRPAEQWFVARQPGVLIQRTRMSTNTENAARRAVASASLPHRHGLPRAYVGTPRGAGRTTILLARTRVSYDSHGRASASAAGGRTRLFRVPAGLPVTYTDRRHDTYALTRTQLRHDVRHGFPDSGSLQPEITVLSALGASSPAAIDVALASHR